MIRAVIPVAGIGSRLKPHTNTIPKVLLTVGDKPILGHIIQKLVNQGITSFTFITGYFEDKIKEYILTDFKNIDAIFINQGELKGLGHAIHCAADTFKEDKILIILGDTIFDVDLTKIIGSNDNYLGLRQVDDPSRFGIAIIENGEIKKLIEKPSEPVSNTAIVGIYFFSDVSELKLALNKIIDENIRTKGEYQLTDAMQIMLESGVAIKPFMVDGWYDCGKPETLLETNQFVLKDKNEFDERESVVIIPPVFIDPSAEITNSVIGPFATIAAGVKVKDSIIRNSIIGQNSEVAKCNFEDSLIGPNSILTGKFSKINTGDSSVIDFN